MNIDKSDNEWFDSADKKKFIELDGLEVKKQMLLLINSILDGNKNAADTAYNYMVNRNMNYFFYANKEGIHFSINNQEFYLHLDTVNMDSNKKVNLYLKKDDDEEEIPF